MRFTPKDSLVLSQVARFTQIPEDQRMMMLEDLSPQAKKIGQYIIQPGLVKLTEAENIIAERILKWQSPGVRKKKPELATTFQSTLRELGQ